MAKVSYAREGDIALVTLSDPTTLNAIDPAMATELKAALTRASAEARAIVLSGEGRAFCSGANLNMAREPEADGRIDLGAELERHYNGLMTQIRDLPIPIVTAITGAAAGIGASLALLGDLIVAGESAYFLQAFRRIGLVPDGGATYLLPRMSTRARAMELMLLGDKLPAPKALEWGLINRCVPDGDVLSAATALAAQLANGPQSLGMIRKLVWEGLDSDWSSQLVAERTHQRAAGFTADFAEGVAAFHQKRPAQFTGK